MKKKMISLVIPVYNEEEVLQMSCERMRDVMRGTDYEFEMIYIDDGSADRTWEQLEKLCKDIPEVRALKFSRNFGHQPAVTAGIDIAQGDAVVIIDADLQDPPEVIPLMIEQWEAGYEVVYGKRAKRQGETFMKKFTAHMYYRVLRSMSAYPIPLDTGDFRLIDRCVADVLRSMREQNRYLRGMAAWAGFKSCPVEYVREERAAGQTHYTFKKMVNLALNGILGFSHTPLIIPFYLGVGFSIITVIGLIITLICAIVGSVAGTVWLFWIIFLLISLLFICMGMQGAYIGRIQDESSARPLYIVSKERNVKKTKDDNKNEDKEE